MRLQNLGATPQGINDIAVLYVQGKSSVEIAGNHRCPLGIDTLGNFYRSFTAIQKYFSKLRISCRESISRVASLVQYKHTHLHSQLVQFLSDFLLHFGRSPHHPIVFQATETLLMHKSQLVEQVVSGAIRKHSEVGGIVKVKGGTGIFFGRHGIKAYSCTKSSHGSSHT